MPNILILNLVYGVVPIGQCFMIHYLIYKITNLVNGKFYIGKHITDDLEDNYWGSGLAIHRAIDKYGIENFVFTVLIDLKNEEEMNLLEELVVNEDFIKRDDIYNMKVGGIGGWLPKKGENNPMHSRRVQDFMSLEEVEQWKANISRAVSGEKNGMYGKRHSDASRKKMSEAMRGENHPMYGKHPSEATRKKLSEAHRGNTNVRGTHWWNNGIINKRTKECPGLEWVPGKLKKKKLEDLFKSL